MVKRKGFILKHRTGNYFVHSVYLDSSAEQDLRGESRECAGVVELSSGSVFPHFSVLTAGLVAALLFASSGPSKLRADRHKMEIEKEVKKVSFLYTPVVSSVS